MKVNLIDRYPMHAGFGPGESFKNSYRNSPSIGAETPPGNALEDLIQVSMDRILWCSDLKLSGPETSLANRVNRKRCPQIHRGHGSLDRREVRTAIDKSCQGHIATNATGTIQIRDSHVRRWFLSSEGSNRQIEKARGFILVASRQGVKNT